MKTAFITGGSSSIGQEIVKQLQDASWDIIAPGHGELDLANVDTIAKRTDKMIDGIRQIDTVIHVAGVWHDNTVAFTKDLEDYTPQQIVTAMNVGVTGFMVVLSRILPHMSQDGMVIGISGTFISGASGWLPYYTSKRALEDMLVGLAQDYPKGPLVYGVSPADTATRAYEKFFPQYMDEAQPASAVADVVMNLLTYPTQKSGTVVEIRNAKARPGFHV
jgi:NAD(P)-dependent dehydrogenase (short-subunit alcohol dehydrogenase family)